MKKSKGIRQGTRKILRKKPKERGMIPVTRALQDFKEGEKVKIVIEPSVHKGQPHRRFHGRTGTVIGKQGKAFVLEVKDKNKKKKLIIRSEHLREIE